MGCVWLGLVQICPSEEASCPIPFPCFMTGTEFVVVNRAIGFVQCICSLAATIVGKTTGYRHSGTGEDDGLFIALFWVSKGV